MNDEKSSLIYNLQLKSIQSFRQSQDGAFGSRKSQPSMQNDHRSLLMGTRNNVDPAVDSETKDKMESQPSALNGVDSMRTTGTGGRNQGGWTTGGFDAESDREKRLYQNHRYGSFDMNTHTATNTSARDAPALARAPPGTLGKIPSQRVSTQMMTAGFAVGSKTIVPPTSRIG